MRLKATVIVKSDYHGDETDKEKIFRRYREYLRQQLGKTVVTIMVEEDVIKGGTFESIIFDEGDDEN